MGKDRGNYFDIWERGEYSTDPRDLVRDIPLGISPSAVIFDRQVFDQVMGTENEIERTEPTGVVEKVVLGK